MAEGVQHNPATQLTRIPAASAGDNQAETGHRTNITSGTGIGGRSDVLGDDKLAGSIDLDAPVPFDFQHLLNYLFNKNVNFFLNTVFFFFFMFFVII